MLIRNWLGMYSKRSATRFRSQSGLVLCLEKARFNDTKLEEAVKKIVMKKTGTNEASMLDIRENPCKVYEASDTGKGSC